MVTGSGRAVARGWSAVRSGRRAFKRWRRARPFPAAVLLVASAIMLLLPPYFTLRYRDLVISINTVGGASALVLGGLLIIGAVVLCVRPKYRVPVGIVAVLASLVALVTANFGGFLLGTIFGLLGSALCLAWTDQPTLLRQAAEKAPGRKRRLVRLFGRGKRRQDAALGQELPERESV
ncbi:DUF6114 domain-containing protein [Amycolatopsis cynarae]|uniref:DUF6114 domain-containing protein n=1 Tax=Amycolatopsis cynarae TaxID=2995223 RepID=A0ABY7BAX8_9PSEU|nr:DUF6114 domain-containing protein [Amycolatopsis sp. HUAS 11-8]WAL68293.1 DUF6114 domain-containing protein [Amycolatopsis sp. HUAS 11-8]